MLKKSKTLKSCKASLQKKKTTTTKIKKKNNFCQFCFTGKSYNIDLYSHRDQTDSESDDWERFSDFVDSELLSDSSNDDCIPMI